MYLFLIVMHVLACLILILVILLQAGRGGGLAETFCGGGGGFQNIFGTKASTFLTRLTGVFAVIFLATSLSLAILSAKRGASLLEEKTVKEEKVKPVEDVQEPAQPVGEKEKEIPQPATSGEQTPQ